MVALLEKPPLKPACPSWHGAEPTPAAPPGWPLLATPVPAGFPSPADDYIEGRLSLDDHLVRNPAATFLVRVQGHSMIAAGIHDGDLLVVDRAVAPTDGSVVVAVVDGAFALKRIGRDPAGRLALAPASEEGAIRLSDPRLELWGVVRWAVHRVWPGRQAA